jgi:hypothetical protein
MVFHAGLDAAAARSDSCAILFDIGRTPLWMHLPTVGCVSRARVEKNASAVYALSANTASRVRDGA